MSKTVLVTGGAGFVGSHLVQRLLDETDWSVVSIDSFRGGGDFFNLIDAVEFDRARVVSLTHDLTVPFTAPQVEYLAAELGVDTIVNVASRSHVGESIRDPASFASNNLQLMLGVLELARQVGVERFVHVSTDEVYGPYWPQTPQDYRPSSPYAASKAAQETLAVAWARTYDLPLTIVNSANMFGERQRASAFVPIVVYALRRGDVVDVHAKDGVVGSRNYSYVGNVADELVAELRRDEPTGRVLLSGQLELTNLEVVTRVADVLGVEPRWRLVDGDRARPGYDQRYPQLGDWSPRVSFDDGLRRTVDWYANED